MQQSQSSNQHPNTHTTQFHSIKHTSQAHKHGTNQQDTQQQNERLNLASLTSVWAPKATRP